MTKGSVVELEEELEEVLEAVIETGLHKGRAAFLTDAVRTLLAARPDIREALACRLYEKGVFSLGRAAEWSGFSIEDMKESLYRAGISREAPESLAELEAMARRALKAAGTTSATMRPAASRSMAPAPSVPLQADRVRGCECPLLNSHTQIPKPPVIDVRFNTGTDGGGDVYGCHRLKCC